MTRRLLFAFVAVALLSTAATAQERTGSIAGTITDPGRAPLPGVTVTVTSPALIGPRTAVTNEVGEFAIRQLPPGVYEIRTDLSGFSPMLRPGVEVRVGQTATVNFRLGLATIMETTTVTAEPPVIDVRNTARNYTVDAKAVELIPISTAQQYTDLWVIAPGVRDNIAGFSSVVRAPSVNGAAVSQNKVFVDGIEVSDHVNAGTTTFLNQAIIQEVAVTTGAFEASAGFGSGGLMNIITRSGGNDLSGGASVVYSGKSLNDTNVQGAQPADIDTWFPEIHLGGPIVRDRLWFFASEKYLQESRGIFNVSAYRTEVAGHEFYGKLTYRPSARHNLIYVFQHDRRKEDPSFGTASFRYDATPVGYFGGYMTGLVWDYQVSERSMLGLVASYFDKPNTTNGRNGNAPRTQFANAAGQIHTTDGNYDRDQTNEQTRPYFAGSYTHNLTFAGSHDIKLSAEWYPQTRRLNRLRMNEVRVYRDSPVHGPRQLWRVLTPRPATEVQNDTVDQGLAVGLQDSWRPLDRLTVNAGIRYESNFTDIEGRQEPLLDYESWSPRLGLAWELDSKTVLKSSASRIGEKFALDFAFTFFPNSIVFDTAESSQVNGVLDRFTQGAPTAATTTRNVARPVPHVWEYVVGVQRQLPGRIALDISYVKRTFGDFADQVDRNLILDIPNRKFVGRVDPAFDAMIDVVKSDREKRRYDAVQIWLNRRLGNRWQFNGSYTYAVEKREGEFGYGTAANAALQFAYGDRARDFYAQELSPRHNLKLSGSYTFPWDITAGVYYSKYSNTTFYDTYQALPAGAPAPRVTLSNGRVVADPLFNPTLLVAPPSENVGKRGGGTNLVNLQIDKGFPIGSHRFRVTALVFNLANSAQPLNYLSTNIANPNYGRPSQIQRPRAGQISIGWDF